MHFCAGYDYGSTRWVWAIWMILQLNLILPFYQPRDSNCKNLDLDFNQAKKCNNKILPKQFQIITLYGQTFFCNIWEQFSSLCNIIGRACLIRHVGVGKALSVYFLKYECCTTYALKFRNKLLSSRYVSQERKMCRKGWFHFENCLNLWAL